MLRPDLPTVMDIVRSDPRMSRATAMLDNVGYPLLSILAGFDYPRFHTLFAPTDEAIEALPDAVLRRLAGEGSDAASFVRRLVTMHWVEDTDLDLSTVADGTEIHTAQSHVTFTVADGIRYLDYAVVLDSLRASNGYVYLIDAVLIPPCESDVGQIPAPTHAPCQKWLEPAA